MEAQVGPGVSGGSVPEFEALVERCLAAVDAEGSQALERLCAEHPERAEELRRRVAPLVAAGLVGQPSLDSLPDRLGEFRILERLGGGGMGIVYRAVQTSLSREVALKVIRPEHLFFPGARERFRREVEAVARLRHPGIAPVYAVGEENGVPFFAMELIEGLTLAEVAQELRGRSPASLRGEDLATLLARRASSSDIPDTAHWSGPWSTVAIRIAHGVTLALDHAHRRGVRHRDIKPSNVMVTASGRVLLMDFGLASTQGTSRLTVSGAHMGTTPYMPPERLRGDATPHEIAGDVYGVGVTLYELLTLRPPFLGTDAEATRQLVLDGTPVHPRTLDRTISWEAETVCLMAMERDPARRYASAAAFAEDLARTAGHQPIAARRPGTALRVRRWTRRRPAAAVGLALGALLLMTLTILVVRERTLRSAATQKANDVLALSAQKDLEDLVARADRLWPAQPEMIPAYEKWLADARELLDGRAPDPEHGGRARPSLAQHKAKLAEVRTRSVVPDPARLAAVKSHPRFAELQAKRAKWTWSARMLGLEPWPSEADVEAESAQESATDAPSLNGIAWQLVNPDAPVFGAEVKALLLARRAVATATDAERAGIRRTLAWSLFRCGRLDDALAEAQRSLEEMSADELQKDQVDLTNLKQAVLSWRGSALARRRTEQEALGAEIEDLSYVVGERVFVDSDDAWWNLDLSRLVSELESLQDPATGLMGDDVAAPHGWGVRKRYEFAKTIGERSVSSPEAQARWAAAIEAIAASSKYGGLVLTPQLGLLPIGADRDSGLWEFWHIPSGDEPQRGEDGKLLLTESMGVVLVLIPGGSFWMGAQRADPVGRNYDPQAASAEGPVHEVTLSPYLLSKYELTQGQWERFTGSNPSAYAPGYRFGDHTTTYLHPVEEVSWDAAMEVLPRLGMTLPTEAQWERGARGGTDTRWSTGQERDTLIGAVNLADQAAARVDATWMDYKDWPELDDGWLVHAPVGSFRPNPFGLHDVHGNVFELCRDVFDPGYYGQSPEKDPVREAVDDHLICYRGGSFPYAASSARSAGRSCRAPESHDGNLGLRPAKTITP